MYMFKGKKSLFSCKYKMNMCQRFYLIFSRADGDQQVIIIGLKKNLKKRAK